MAKQKQIEMKLNSLASTEELIRLREQKANKTDLDLLKEEMRDLEKQINYLEMGSDQDLSLDSQEYHDLIMKALKNQHGYGEEFWKVLEKEKEEGREPGVRKYIKYIQI